MVPNQLRAHHGHGVRKLGVSFLIMVHAPDAILDDRGNLIGMGRVIGLERGMGMRQARRLCGFGQLFLTAASDRVPLRPGRRVPRAVKRRPKTYP